LTRVTNSKESIKEILVESLYRASKEAIGEDVSQWIEAGKFYGVAESTVYQAHRGEGTQATYELLLCGFYKATPAQLKKTLTSIIKTLSKKPILSDMEEIIQDTWSLYGDHEFAAKLKILQATYQIEIDLGVRKKPGRPPKKK